MKDPIIIIGIGEMAGVFARGFLRVGHPVYPVTRDMDMEVVAQAVPAPELVLLAVGESDLHPTLEQIPAAWRDRLGLLQNELLPRDWDAHNIQEPTVIAVWFEKKKGKDYKVLVSSPAHGPKAELIERALGSIDIPVQVVTTKEQLLFELVRKNVYILTTNIAGLVTAGTVDELWNQHQELARKVASEVMDIQFWLVNRDFDRDALIEGMVEGINGDLQHKCMGRSAPGRLARALGHADDAGLSVPTLRQIQAQAAK